MTSSSFWTIAILFLIMGVWGKKNKKEEKMKMKMKMKPSELKIKNNVFMNLRRNIDDDINGLLTQENIEDLKRIKITDVSKINTGAAIVLFVLSFPFPLLFLLSIPAAWFAWSTKNNLSMDLIFKRENSEAYLYSFEKTENKDDVLKVYNQIKELVMNSEKEIDVEYIVDNKEDKEKQSNSDSNLQDKEQRNEGFRYIHK